jgi:hypothetical protein
MPIPAEVRKKGCLGPSPFDWFVGCQYHNTADGEHVQWCISCRIAADHNEEIRQRLAALDKKANDDAVYYRLPLRDANETAALLDLLKTTKSEILRPVLQRLLHFAKEVSDADPR